MKNERFAAADANQVSIILHWLTRRLWIYCFYLGDLLGFVDAVAELQPK